MNPMLDGSMTGFALLIGYSVPLDIVLSLLSWLAFLVVPTGVAYVIVYLLFSLPLRRRERARLFLDLLETTLNQGRPVEETLTAISNTRDPAMGVRFHVLGAYLGNGLNLTRALDKVPRLLPPQVTEMLKAGLHIGDLSKVIPACRQTIQDATSETRSAVNYLIVMVFIITPMSVFLPLSLLQFVVPIFNLTMYEMLEGSSPPVVMQMITLVQPWLTAGFIALLVALWFGALMYIGGPRFTSWLQAGIPRMLDRLQLLLPWQYKRIQRDFSSVLAVLLDSEVPEAESLRLAARCTDNALFSRRAERAIERLQQGAGLSEAMTVLDDTGEFRWRLTNAIHGEGRFLRALAGWHEALDAKAYQQQQSAAQIFTTTLVLLNGLLISVVMLTMFSALVAIINAGVLW